MVNLTNFVITLTRESPVYFSGQEISGNVLLRITERQKINAIYLDFKGEAYVRWTESKSQGMGKDRKTVNETHWDRETVFDLKQFFMHKDPNMGELYLEPNEYNFPFKFTLPAGNLPTSFYHREGRIRYWLEAIVDIPWSFNRNVIKHITVINALDLNLLPALRQPVGVSDTKVICCGPCKSDPIIIEFNTSKTGYVPGETIVFNASVDNRSKENIKGLSAELTQRIVFIVRGHRRRHLYTIAKVSYTGDRIGPGTLGNWSNASLQIPIVCPSLLDTCKIIKLEYKLTLIVNASALSVSSRLVIPIVIGTIPINTSSSQATSNVTYNSIPDAALIYNKNEIDNNQQPTETNNRVSNNETEDNYKPKYPYYKDFSLS